MDAPTPTPPESSKPGESILAIDVTKIRPNPFQPRITFQDEQLDDLRLSIQEHGILQPLVVRPTALGYELIAGERRLRASTALGLETVPAVVRHATDEEMQTLALVENVQRVDLNAMEKARALNAMMQNFGLTQQLVAKRVGKARTTIANLVRLLDLPEQIQGMVQEGQLSGAQARALLQADGRERRLALANEAIRYGLSVRDIERRARSGPTIGKRKKPEPDPYVQDIEQRLTRALSTKVRLKPGRVGGSIEVRYAGPDELDRLIERLED
jgi:ParB family chromosome partitioning protein